MANQLLSFNSHKFQGGDFLLESLIGTLLTAIVAMGVMYSTTKVMLSQRELTTQEIIIGQMRALLQNHVHDGSSRDLCAAPANSIKIHTVTSKGVSKDENLSITCPNYSLTDYSIIPSITAKTIAGSNRIQLKVQAEGLDYELGGL